MHVHKNWLYQVPSSAYNQPVQWAITEDEDKVEDLWRGLYCLGQQRQDFLEQSVSCLLVVKASLSHFWLLAVLDRFILDLYLETSGCSGVVRTHCFNGKTRKLKLSFECLKKIDNILIKEKQTHYFDEKQLVCCQLGTKFTLLVKFAAGSDGFFVCAWVQKENWLSQPGSLVHSVPQKDITLTKVWNCKTTYMQQNHVRV